MNTQTRRGQVMGLFAVTMIFIALMICLTLAIGTKIREKSELQTMADAAAYSQAVVTARTFNGISVMNRAMTSEMVALAGVQSLISWSGYVRAAVWGAEDATWTLCGGANPAFNNLIAFDSVLAIPAGAGTLGAAWTGLDTAAGAQALSILNVGTVNLYNSQSQIYHTTLGKLLESQALVSTLAAFGTQGSPWSDVTAPPAAATGTPAVTIRETGAGGMGAWSLTGNMPSHPPKTPCTANGIAGAACDAADVFDHHLTATQGSRGYAFVTGRVGGDTPINAKLATLLAGTGATAVISPIDGSGYYNSSRMHSSGATTLAGWGDDHGNLMVTACGKTGTVVLDAWLMSDENQWSDDDHAYGEVMLAPASTLTAPAELASPGGNVAKPAPMLGAHGLDESAQAGAQKRHDYWACVACDGIWPFFIDYNENVVDKQADIYGQPKNFAVLQRDYAKRGMLDPFNLTFTFKFSQTGQKFDARGLTLTTNGTPINLQTVLSTGIAYYHRGAPNGAPTFWREPPNLLNPFWRATLVAANIDENGTVPNFGSEKNDVYQTLLNVGDTNGAAVYQGLTAGGVFKGIH